MEKKEEGKGRPLTTHTHTVESVVETLLFSSPSQTLRLTPLTSALRAARAHDAVLRMYVSRSAFALHQDSRGYFGILSKPQSTSPKNLPRLRFFVESQSDQLWLCGPLQDAPSILAGCRYSSALLHSAHSRHYSVAGGAITITTPPGGTGCFRFILSSRQLQLHIVQLRHRSDGSRMRGGSDGDGVCRAPVRGE